MGCHLGVLLTAVLRGGRRRAGGGPGLHPVAAVGGDARATPAPAKGREAVGKLRHGGRGIPCAPPTPLHPYLWGWGSSHPLLESGKTPWAGQWAPGNSRRGQGWWWLWRGAGGWGGRGLCPPSPSAALGRQGGLGHGLGAPLAMVSPSPGHHYLLYPPGGAPTCPGHQPPAPGEGTAGGGPHGWEGAPCLRRVPSALLWSDGWGVPGNRGWGHGDITQ